MKMPRLLLFFTVLGVFMLSGCVLLRAVPPKLSEAQSKAVNEMRRSLPQRDRTFQALLAKIGEYPYFEKKAAVAPGPLNHASGIREFAAGVFEGDLSKPNVREYAFLEAASGTTFFCWRIFVREGRVIYMEYTPISERDFHYYFEPVESR